MERVIEYLIVGILGGVVAIGVAYTAMTAISNSINQSAAIIAGASR